MEASVLLASVAQRFEVSLVPGRKAEPMASITLRPANGVHVRLRDDKSTALRQTTTSQVLRKSRFRRLCIRARLQSCRSRLRQDWALAP